MIRPVFVTWMALLTWWDGQPAKASTASGHMGASCSLGFPGALLLPPPGHVSLAPLLSLLTLKIIWKLILSLFPTDSISASCLRVAALIPLQRGATFIVFRWIKGDKKHNFVVHQDICYRANNWSACEVGLSPLCAPNRHCVSKFLGNIAVIYRILYGIEEGIKLHSIREKYLAQQQPGWCVMIYPTMAQSWGAGKQRGNTIPSPLSFIHLFHKYLLRPDSLLGTVARSQDAVVKQR